MQIEYQEDTTLVCIKFNCITVLLLSYVLVYFSSFFLRKESSNIASREVAIWRLCIFQVTLL